MRTEEQFHAAMQAAALGRQSSGAPSPRKDPVFPAPDVSLDPIQAANEEANPELRAIRKLIREPRAIMIRSKEATMVRGVRYAPGEEFVIVNPRKLPPGLISESDAVALIQAGAEVVTESDLEEVQK
jgi:hypothetical protein